MLEQNTAMATMNIETTSADKSVMADTPIPMAQRFNAPPIKCLKGIKSYQITTITTAQFTS